MDSGIDNGAVVIILVSFGDINEARRIAGLLVKEKLVGCVNLFPCVESIYRWKESVESAQETSGILKTTKERVLDVEARYRALHSYETPEFLVLAVSGGSSGYLKWLVESVLSS